MIGQAPRKDLGRPKQNNITIEHRWWHNMASLAADCGYLNIQKPYSDVVDADEKMTKDFLRHVRPSPLYDVDGNDFDAKVRFICKILTDIQPRQLEDEFPTLSSDHYSCGSRLSSRCGRHENSHN